MSQTTLYLECNSGISGDMTVAALLDLGADRQVLEHALKSLPLTGYTIEIKEVFKSGIRACDFHVVLEQDNHDHDMDYLYGNGQEHAQSSDPKSKQKPDDHRSHDFGHTHEHAHIEGHTHSSAACSDDAIHLRQSVADPTHSHTARNLHDITAIIQAGQLTEHARELALRIFHILAEAEASVHGKTIDEVHFHEVGAVDSIVDIVAAAVCIDDLHPDRIVVSPLTDGTGQIRCQHGLIPVPVPATAAIAAANHLKLKLSTIQGELVTPTGAAIAAALQSDAKLPETFQIQKIGFGAGKRDYEATGLLRAMLLTDTVLENQDTVLTLETNIDDCSGEALSFTLQQLMEAGALDAFYAPIFMKKGRPAYLLKVICTAKNRARLESIIFRNTTTIGIRIQEVQRTKLVRRIIAVETPWGMADIKCCTHGGDTYYYPENDSVRQLALLQEIGFPEMYNMIQSYVREHAQI